MWIEIWKTFYDLCPEIVLCQLFFQDTMLDSVTLSYNALFFFLVGVLACVEAVSRTCFRFVDLQCYVLLSRRTLFSYMSLISCLDLSLLLLRFSS